MFYSNAVMKKYLKLYSDVLIVDITHQITMYNLNMPIILAVNNHGKNVVVGYGLLHDIQENTVNWFFEHFYDLCKECEVKIGVFFTDEGSSLINAVQQYFPHVPRLSCTWHVAKNLEAHCSNTGLRKKVLNLPYISKIEEFELKSSEIIREMLNLQVPEKEQNYFAQRFLNPELWCIAFQRKYMTLGISTTSRIESMNSLIKRYLNGHCRLGELRLFIAKVTEEPRFNMMMAPGKKMKQR